jgi:hypothetical protein
VSVKICKNEILIVAGAVALLSIVVYAYIAQLGISESGFWGSLPLVIFLLPGLLILLGTCAHVAHRHWGIVMSCAFCIVNEIMIVFTFPGVAYVFQEPEKRSILRVIALDFILVILVLVLWVVLAFAEDAAAQQIVGREAR